MSFYQARDALDAGDLAALTAILDEYPDVVHFRCHQGDWYSSGYFAGATLLHHVAGNPIRCPLPANIVTDLDRPDVLDDPLWNQAPATAEALIGRGSPMELRHAAALGRLDAVADLMDSADQDEREEALILASVRGQLDSVRMLVSHGARGDRIGRHGPAPALHEAANRGFLEIVAHLLDHGADPTVRDTRFGATAAAWAEHGRPEDLPAMRALFGKRGV
jgi:hypothetical protein